MQVSVSSRADRPYESQLDTCRTCRIKTGKAKAKTARRPFPGCGERHIECRFPIGSTTCLFESKYCGRESNPQTRTFEIRRFSSLRTTACCQSTEGGSRTRKHLFLRQAAHRWPTSAFVESGAPGNRTPISCLQNRRLPVGRAPHVVFSLQCPEQESNLQTSGFKPDRSTDWRI